MKEDSSNRNANHLLDCISHNNAKNKESRVVEQRENDENFYKDAALQFTQAILTVTTGIAIYKVKPDRQSKEM